MMTHNNKRKKKTSRKRNIGIQTQRQFLDDHIMLCLRNHTTYIMCGQLDGIELCHIFGIMVVEKNAVMNQGSDFTLIHYMCVDPDLCQ